MWESITGNFLLGMFWSTIRAYLWRQRGREAGSSYPERAGIRPTHRSTINTGLNYVEFSRRPNSQEGKFTRLLSDCYQNTVTRDIARQQKFYKTTALCEKKFYDVYILLQFYIIRISVSARQAAQFRKWGGGENFKEKISQYQMHMTRALRVLVNLLVCMCIYLTACVSCDQI